MKSNRSSPPLLLTISGSSSFSIRLLSEESAGEITLAIALMSGIGAKVLPLVSAHTRRMGGLVRVTERVGAVTHIRVTLPSRSGGHFSHLSQCCRFAITL